jgi:hypothetical protein
MDRSGAVLSWNFFFPEKPLPRLLSYVQDQDLWRWEVPFSREFNIARETIPFDFIRWDELMDETKIDDLVERVNGPS